ncbi:MAG: iron-containing alcohol dehydrogenase, partial [Lachnospiraceae bacterium]|nr:iron-containing alcohol dehydrogenase [Lachnospiraceae bacterium]
RKCGALDDVEAALGQEELDYLIFSDVEENPSVETVLFAGEKYGAENIDIVIGIGGGSPLDAAKAIALKLSHPEADAAYLYDKEKDPMALPLVCIPTTCGTGSEVTGVSVLTRHDKKTKISMVHKVFPDLALVDGKYISSAPDSLIANTSVDALAHLLESVLNAKADDYVRMTAAAGLECWGKNRDILTGERKRTAADNALLMRSSVLAGMSIAQSGTSLPHALSYPLTYDLGIPHGRAVGYFLSSFVAAAPKEQSSGLLRAAGFEGLKDFDDFMKKVLGEFELSEEELQRCFEMLENNSAKMNSASFAIDKEMLKKIIWYK